MTGPENPIPESSLLPVVMALAPALPMMEIMVFNDDLRTKELKQPGHGRGTG